MENREKDQFHKKRKRNKKRTIDTVMTLILFCC